jgi:hypothetical protein
MNRRRFLAVLAGAAAVAALDPERLLWTPGQTTHILPPPHGWRPDLCRCGQPVGFHKAFDLDRVVKDAAKDLADRIDADGLKNFQFYAGQQWEIDGQHQIDAARYASLKAAQRAMNARMSEQLETLYIPHYPRRLGVVKV